MRPVRLARQWRNRLVFLEPGHDAIEIFFRRRRAAFLANIAVFAQRAFEKATILAGHDIESDFRRSLAGRRGGEYRDAGEEVGKSQKSSKRQGAT